MPHAQAHEHSEKAKASTTQGAPNTSWHTSYVGDTDTRLLALHATGRLSCYVSGSARSRGRGGLNRMRFVARSTPQFERRCCATVAAAGGDQEPHSRAISIAYGLTRTRTHKTCNRERVVQCVARTLNRFMCNATASSNPRQQSRSSSRIRPALGVFFLRRRGRELWLLVVKVETLVPVLVAQPYFSRHRGHHHIAVAGTKPDLSNRMRFRLRRFDLFHELITGLLRTPPAI